MPIPAFVILSWPIEHAESAAVAAKLAAALEALGLLPRLTLPGLTLLSGSADRRMTLRSSSTQSIFVFGELFDAQAVKRFSAPYADLQGWTETAPPALARKLVRSCWGRYVAVLRDDDGTVAVLRDPSGAVPLYQNRHADLTIFTTGIDRRVADALGMRMSLAWDNLARLAAFPFCATHLTGLDSVEIVPPGILTYADTRRARLPVWTMTHAAARRDEDGTPDEWMRRSLAACLAAWTAGRDRIAIELSGGFDSSSVVGALRATVPAKAVMAIHYALPDAEGDESARAQLVAEHNGVSLIDVPVSPDQLDYRRLFTLRAGAQHRIAWLDMIQDQATPRIKTAADIDVVMTGHGGDVLFYQFASLMVAIDCLATEGPGRIWARSVVDAARRGRHSIWPILAASVAHYIGRRAGAAPLGDMRYLTADARSLLTQGLPRHVWQEQADALLPGKRLQIDSLAYTQLFNGPSWAGEAGALVHPLLSQPMIEICLALPVHALAFGVTDRALARRAFSRWLPPSIAAGQTKAGASAYYARAVRANLPLIRQRLLEGSLVRHRVLDRGRLAHALDPAQLLIGADYGALTGLLSLEAWVQGWS